MKNKLRIIRITLWWAIIADGFEGIRMLFPTFFLKSTGFNLNVDKGLTLGLMYGAPVMLGWALILFWADRNPIQRKGVLFYLIPVIIGYIIIEIVQVANGLVALNKIIPVIILQFLLISMSVLSLFLGKKIEEKN